MSRAVNKIFFFVGTTAELIKVFPVMLELKKNNIGYEIIASGQNDILDSELISLYELNKPKYVLSKTNHKKSAFGLFWWTIKTLIHGSVLLAKEIPQKKNCVMVVHGDTVSTVIGALIAKKLGMKVAHIEAGLRSYNIWNPFPEELDRIITSKVADFHFAPNQWAVDNLKKRKGVIVNTGENTLLDSLRHAIADERLSSTFESLAKNEYFVLVVHRQENLFDTDFIKRIMSRCIEESAKTHCVLVLHEMTRLKLEELGLINELKNNENITLIPRLPYFEFMKVLQGCTYMVTDGGSNQEESYYLGKPCLILRTHTERTEGLNSNVLLSDKNDDVINRFFNELDRYKSKDKLKAFYPSAIIANHLEKI